MARSSSSKKKGSSKSSVKPATSRSSAKAAKAKGESKTGSVTTTAKKQASTRTTSKSAESRDTAATAKEPAKSDSRLPKSRADSNASEAAASSPGAPAAAEPTAKTADRKAGDAADLRSEKAQSASGAAELIEEAVSELDGVRLPAARGRMGVFGGPKDRSAKPDDKLGLPTGRYSQYDRVHSLDARGFYCAMRWDYRQRHMSPEEGKRWWANKKLLVTNPANAHAVVVRAVDYGPHENTGLTIAISPGAAQAIGAEVGDEVEVVFADQRAPLGPAE